MKVRAGLKIEKTIAIPRDYNTTATFCFSSCKYCNIKVFEASRYNSNKCASNIGFFCHVKMLALGGRYKWIQPGCLNWVYKSQ